MGVKRLKFLNRDENDMPLYVDDEGNYWIDIDCREGHNKNTLYSCFLNCPVEGPDKAMGKGTECVFIPERIVDPADKEPKMLFLI